MIFEIGTGVFIIALLWVGTLLLSLLLSRTAVATKLAVFPLVILAITITLILVFFPRAAEEPTPSKEIQIVDSFFIGRFVLLSFVSVVFLATLFLLLPLHLLEPVYAKPLRAP